MEKEKIEYLINYYLHLLLINEKEHLEKYEYLDQIKTNQEKINLANLLVENHSDKIKWNNYPKCGGLARTPKAKQCRHCYYSWHKEK